MPKKFPIWILPKKWVVIFVACWRTFERTLNPAFLFLLKCAKCGDVGNVRFIHSPKRTDHVIGLQCGNCENTIKFEGGIGPEDTVLPKRFIEMAESVLQPPDEGPPKLDPKYAEEVSDLVFKTK